MHLQFQLLARHLTATTTRRALTDTGRRRAQYPREAMVAFLQAREGVGLEILVAFPQVQERVGLEILVVFLQDRERVGLEILAR